MSARFNSICHSHNNNGLRTNQWSRTESYGRILWTHDVRIVLGVSKDKLGWEKVTERQRIGSMDGNGKGQAECLCTEWPCYRRNIVQTQTEIFASLHGPYLMADTVTNGRYRRSLLDARVIRSRQQPTYSDHQLVLTREKPNLCIAKEERKGGRKRCNISKVGDHRVKEEFHHKQISSIGQQWGDRV